ncbi:MAG TPA: ribbon-helix-helix protein, CopG family [Candidatus Thermoplasmatota archaeon]
MSKRLQVLLDEAEYRELQRAARSRGMTVSEWVRRSLREARRAEPGRDAGVKLEVVRAAAGHRFPTADIDRMLREIEQGYVEDAD